MGHKRIKPLPPAPHVVEPNAVYCLDTLRHVLRLSVPTTEQEMRRGRLRAVQVGKRKYVLGKWLLEWLETLVAEQTAVEEKAAFL